MTKKKYIDSEVAFNAILKLVPKVDDDGYCWVIRGDAAKAIDSIPAADVRPVVRGRNIYDTVKGHCEFKCSVCEVELSSVYGGRNDFGLDGGYFNFCPNCGASMEES